MTDLCGVKVGKLVTKTQSIYQACFPGMILNHLRKRNSREMVIEPIRLIG